MAVLGPADSLLIALGLTNWSFTCRIARASTLSLKSQGYVQAHGCSATAICAS